MGFQAGLDGVFGVDGVLFCIRCEGKLEQIRKGGKYVLCKLRQPYGKGDVERYFSKRMK